MCERNPNIAAFLVKVKGVWSVFPPPEDYARRSGVILYSQVSGCTVKITNVFGHISGIDLQTYVTLSIKN